MDSVWDFLCDHSIVEFHRWIQSLEEIHPMSPGSASQLIRQSVWLATFDGEVHEVEGRIAMLFPLLRRPDFETLYIVPVVDPARLVMRLPNEVGSSSLTLILEYLCFFQAPGRSDEETETFFLSFWIFSTPLSLCELLTAARSLEVSPLVDIATCALLRMICDMKWEEFSKAFHLPEALAEWEQHTTLKSPQELTEKVDRVRRNRLINQLVVWKKRSPEEKTSGKDEKASIRTSSSAVDWHEHHRGSHSLDIFLYLIGMEGNGPEGEGNGEENWQKEWAKNLERKKEEQAKFVGPLTGLNGSEMGRILSMNSTEDSLPSTVDVRNGQEAETTEEIDDEDERYISAVSEPERLWENEGIMDEICTDRSVKNPWSKPIRHTWAKLVTQIEALASYVHERNRDNNILLSHVSQDEHRSHVVQPSHVSQDEHRSHVVQIDNGGVSADNLEVAVRNENGDVQSQNNNAEVAAAENREVTVPNDNGKVQIQNDHGEVAAANNRRVEVRKDHEGAYTDSREVEVRNDHEEVAPHTGNREVAAKNYNREVAAFDNQEVGVRNYQEEVAAHTGNREVAAKNYNRAVAAADYREVGVRNHHEEVAAHNDVRKIAGQNDEVQNDKFPDSDADQSQNDSPQEESLSDFGNDGEDSSQSYYREVAIRAGGSNAEEALKRTSSTTDTESWPQCKEFWDCCFWPLSFVALLILGFLLWGNY